MPSPITNESAKITPKFAPSCENSSMASVAAMRTGKPASTGNCLEVFAIMGVKRMVPTNCESRITAIR